MASKTLIRYDKEYTAYKKARKIKLKALGKFLKGFTKWYIGSYNYKVEITATDIEISCEHLYGSFLQEVMPKVIESNLTYYIVVKNGLIVFRICN
jgi:hypothetical protein